MLLSADYWLTVAILVGCALQLNRWWVAALQRPSVGGSFKAPEEGSSYKEKLLEHYQRYADGSANSTSARDFK